jgi:hypothetical protein
MPEKEVADLDREIAEMKQEAAAKELLDNQIKLVTTIYEKAQAYTNLLIAAGYAGFFALWSLTRQYITKEQAIGAALFVLTSLVTFVLFEVFKNVASAYFLIPRVNALGDPRAEKDLQSVLQRFKVLDAASKAFSLKFVKVWYVVLTICIVTGLAGTAVLAYAFVRQLLQSRV